MGTDGLMVPLQEMGISVIKKIISSVFIQITLKVTVDLQETQHRLINIFIGSHANE